MDNKFFVSYEAARLLKEKGYDELASAAWCGMFGEMRIAPIHFAYKNSDYPDDMKLYSAPTKAEAIDWLESKGLIVETKYYSNRGNNRGKWSARINRKDSWAYMAIGEYYLTRLEAEDAAIIKACELL